MGVGVNIWFPTADDGSPLLARAMSELNMKRNAYLASFAHKHTHKPSYIHKQNATHTWRKLINYFGKQSKLKHLEGAHSTLGNGHRIESVLVSGCEEESEWGRLFAKGFSRRDY